MLRIRLALLMGTLCLLGLATMPGCARKESGDSNVIKIISSLPRTGSAKGQTDTIVNGIKMAFDEAEYKVGGYTIEYLDLDDATAADGKWSPERESANADQAVKDPDVMVYIGPYNSGAAKISIPILNEAGILMISPAVTGTGFTKPGKGEAGEPDIYRKSGKKNFTRVVPADDLQGALGADWAKDMGVKKVFILDDKEVYGRGIADIFEERCKEIGIEVLGHESIDYKQSEFRATMNTIKAKGPDLVYFGGTSQTGAGQVAKDMVAAGLAESCKIMVPDGCFENAFIQAAGAEAFRTLQAYITFGGIPPEKLTGKGAEFVKKYKEKYKVEPEGYAVYGYESAKVALLAIERGVKTAGKKDREAIRAAAFAIKDFDGALGKWSFDPEGDTTLTTMSGNKVVNGAFAFDRMLGTK